VLTILDSSPRRSSVLKFFDTTREHSMELRIHVHSLDLNGPHATVNLSLDSFSLLVQDVESIPLSFLDLSTGEKCQLWLLGRCSREHDWKAALVFWRIWKGKAGSWNAKPLCLEIKRGEKPLQLTLCPFWTRNERQVWH